MSKHSKTRRSLTAVVVGTAAIVATLSTVALAGATLPDAPTGALSNLRLFVNPSSPAAQQADAWKSSRPSDAARMRYIADQPSATWFGDWNSDIRQAVSDVANQAAGRNALPVMVAYDIPNRDCGSYSAGGASDANKYANWIHAFADGLRGHRALVVLEPDAVAASDCLSQPARDARFSMLNDAVKTLKSAGAFVYLDAGHSNWISASAMADRLQKAGINEADGFSLNVSNFGSTASNVAFGDDLSRRVGGKHYVIDTSRNGVAPTANGQWCNPGGQALGDAPTVHTGHALADALLWIKQPGESDGTCNGGPKAGQWWADYALGLAQRANIASN